MSLAECVNTNSNLGVGAAAIHQNRKIAGKTESAPSDMAMKALLAVFSIVALVSSGCVNGKGAIEKAAEIEIRDAGVATGGAGAAYVGPGEVYVNQHVPQDFSLPLPVLTGTSNGTIDLGRCYMDFAPAGTSLDAHTRRLCGIQFTQVQLELRALFLDLALPDIRSYCRNQLEGCNLAGREFTITVSEPVMRRVQQLFEFYKYTGLENYFEYNGYAIRNGAKIPFVIETYEETCVEPYDYRARIRTRVIGTSGGVAETRDNAGDVIIMWNRQRHNLLLDFRTNVELFGFQINLRRTYEFSSREAGVRYTSSVNYFTGESVLVHGNAVVAEPCTGNQCVKFRHIAAEYSGTDALRDGLSGAEAQSDVLRFSEGVIDARGGLVDSYTSFGGVSNRERLAFSGSTVTDLQFYGSPGNPLALVSGDAAGVATNTYLNAYATPTRLAITMLADVALASPVAPRELSWVAVNDPKDAYHIRGFAVAGHGQSFTLRWQDKPTYVGRFAFSGAQTYGSATNTSYSIHPLY